jgi:tRNA modification GTPase
MNVTKVSCLTPAGIGAIAVLAVRGPDSWELVRAVFRPRSGSALPNKPLCGPTWHGKIEDDVVLSVKSLDPWPWVEIHCHGGLQVIHLLMTRLEDLGATPCSWTEFVRHTEGINARAEAAIALANALTSRTASILLDQYQGAWEKAINNVVELCARGEGQAVESELAQLSARINVGLHLTKPWKVVVAGATNVGKSSLVNALVGYERCIVAPTPGTTRDVVTTTIALGGWPVALADTAGLRNPADPLEHEGMRLAQRAIEDADCRLWVIDGSQVPVWPRSQADYLFVINKIDLPARWDFEEASGAVRISAPTGEGIRRLVQELTRRLVPVEPEPGSTVPFTVALGRVVNEAMHFCRNGEFELVSSVLRASL